MQRLDLVHPGEGQLVVGPIALGNDGDFVLARAFERPVMIGGDILDHRKRVVSGIDDAFEEGHAVSTLPLPMNKTWWVLTQQGDACWPDAPLHSATPGLRQTSPARSDVICGIGATMPP